MKKVYQVSGMTCLGCAASVEEKLSKITGVENVDVNLKTSEAIVSMESLISYEKFREVLPEKYSIQLKLVPQVIIAPPKKSKLQQLKPLFLIFGYLFAACVLINYKNWNTREAMLDFMGLFFIVFSFFKFLDINGFSRSFKMYDPLAKQTPFYARLYPFIELSLGLSFLLEWQINIALLVTILILGITTVGVIRILLDKKEIQCACLGTTLKLPMTEATLIENVIMLGMAIFVLLGSILV